ncbi:hydrolase [Lichenihabitans sp. Uapishka_5]|uniref:hydrolase n=1 Tax=Lichenihabitans sp. Uapishka_5 TaxID=3037302 RepID=UPI0029E7F9A3|nr:hydrolase [Lichenihabitans sp. Uapishka_5]MDX7950186.1 hydrolase [Lichenihabitans sp. Uapishka_5]
MSAATPPRAWQRMLSGRRLDLLAPSPDDIAIADVAHGLARVARWNGQTLGAHVFSVAQHSLLVERVFAIGSPDAPAAERLAALLHDAAEYVVGDLISPFKAALGNDYKAVEHRVLGAIQARFGIAAAAAAAAEIIKRADQAVARMEATALAGFADDEATAFFGPPFSAAPLEADALEPWPADRAQSAFLARFAALSKSNVIERR